MAAITFLPAIGKPICRRFPSVNPLTEGYMTRQLIRLLRMRNMYSKPIERICSYLNGDGKTDEVKQENDRIRIYRASKINANTLYVKVGCRNPKKQEEDPTLWEIKLVVLKF